MKLGERLLKYQWVTLSIIFLTAGIPLTGWIAGILMAFITLRLGVMPGVRALIAGLLPIFILNFIVSPYFYEATVNFGVGIVNLLLHLPALFIMAVVLYSRTSLQASLVSGAVYYGLLVIFLQLTHLLPTPELLMDTIGTHLEQAMVASSTDENANPEMIQESKEMVHDFITFMSYGWIALLYLGDSILLFIARSWQARLFNPRGFHQEFTHLRYNLPVLIVALAIALTLPYNEHMFFWIAVCGGIASMLLLFPGIGLIHWYVEFKKKSVFWLILFYVLFLLNMLLPIIIAISLTIVNTFVDVRQRIQKKS